MHIKWVTVLQFFLRTYLDANFLRRNKNTNQQNLSNFQEQLYYTRTGIVLVLHHLFVFLTKWLLFLFLAKPNYARF